MANIIEFNGEERSISDWGRLLGLSRERMRQRLQDVSAGKITLEEAITTPRGKTCASAEQNRVNYYAAKRARKRKA